jgi:hypothetical protein
VNEVKRYWRDKVVSLLQWGAGLSVLLAGWAIQSQEKFKLVGASWPEQKDEILAAVGLLSVSVLYAPLLPLAIWYIYKNFLDKETDETVLPYPFAMLCAVVLPLIELVIAILMCIL